MADEIVVEYRELAMFPGYRFGSDGSVWTGIEQGRWHKPAPWKQRAQQLSKAGYWTITMPLRRVDGTIGKRTFLTHHLILMAFRGPCPSGLEGCHNNGVKTDNRESNLRWDTHKSNNDDKKAHGTLLIGERHQNSTLSDAKVLEIRKLHESGLGYKRIGAQYGLTPSHVRDVIKRKIWSHV